MLSLRFFGGLFPGNEADNLSASEACAIQVRQSPKQNPSSSALYIPRTEGIYLCRNQHTGLMNIHSQYQNIRNSNANQLMSIQKGKRRRKIM